MIDDGSESIQLQLARTAPPYDKEYAVLLDYDPNRPRVVLFGGAIQTTPHEQAGDTVFAFFNQCTTAQVVPISIKRNQRKNADKADFLTQMHRVLHGRSRGEVVYIYFQGHAKLQNGGKSYTLTSESAKREEDFIKVFSMMEGCSARKLAIDEAKKMLKGLDEEELEERKSQKKPTTAEDAENEVNANDYGLVADCKCDIVLIWDAFFPEFLKNIFRREDGRGCLEVFSRPMQNEAASGRLLEEPAMFTNHFVKTFAGSMRSNSKWEHYTVDTLSIAKGMGFTHTNGTRHSNCHHYKSDETRGGAIKLITRAVWSPDDVRTYGKLCTRRLVLQGVGPEPVKPTQLDRLETLEAKKAREEAEAKRKMEEDSNVSGITSTSTSVGIQIPAPPSAAALPLPVPNCRPSTSVPPPSSGTVGAFYSRAGSTFTDDSGYRSVSPDPASKYY